MSEKAENVQRKTVKELQKAAELLLTIDTLKDYKNGWLLGRKQKEMDQEVFFIKYCILDMKHSYGIATLFQKNSPHLLYTGLCC